ncbi:hypothetical protein GCM10011376_00460 [Nocardioides flavus (ex Wang et al. 2016)]|uniref:Galactosyl transferase GMA12/MNN10 family protein n=1 Tax=Nocardioides flavus (ex Wang et al. 2016) TaxID=2058780 RepID=A0ABQ3HF63_9ACTN|nr:hypothetical protein [Nocardioides flavus (ex Wang et al. 2016)]GHE14886.1 hypothetical protein GCM10011376_00460 [Nocardioides flavus (ex Wang et al. 2016)]
MQRGIGDGADICLVSGGDEIRLRSYVNHAVYARLHELDYRLECGVDEGIGTKFFYKTSILARVLPRYDWVVWLDDDAFITDFDRDGFRQLIEQAEADGHSIVIAEGPLEPNGFWSVANTGVMCLKRSPEVFDLLSVMDDSHLEFARDWWDDERHGTFTGGDQDLFVWWMETRGHRDRVRIVEHHALNSRGHYYEDSLSDAFVMHFCGYPDKKIGVVAFAERFGIGQELVPEDLLDRFSVKVRSPMTRPEIAARTQAWRWRGRLKPYLKPVWDKWRERRG